MTPPRPLVVVVTGLSGAGKSTALHALEDLDFFCIDNLPTVLAPQAVALCEHGGMTRVALGIDVRVRAFLGEVGNVLALLEGGDAQGRGQREVQVIFLDASDEMLLRRFSETRRRHPLDTSGLDGAGPVIEGIRLERERLAGLRARATRVFDTTLLSVHDLRRGMVAQFGPAADGAPQRMSAHIVSFGFKYGAPVDADIVLDVRFLENPYFVPTLKDLPGTDPAVSEFVHRQPETKEFLARTLELLSFVLPKYEREGKSYLTVGIGCTGGRHRSVVLAEALASALAARAGQTIELVHRDIARKTPASEPEPRSVSTPRIAVAPVAEETRETRHAQSPLDPPVPPVPPRRSGAPGGGR
jgi:RNase adapter protein RapZ